MVKTLGLTLHLNIKFQVGECAEISSRRHLLTTTGGAIGLASIGAFGALTPAAKALAETAKDQAPSLPEYAKWKNADSLIIHSANTMETKRSAFGSGVITPLDRLFVRNNITPPSEDIVADPDAWELQIEGVKNPTTISVAELKTLGMTSVANDPSRALCTSR